MFSKHRPQLFICLPVPYYRFFGKGRGVVKRAEGILIPCEQATAFLSAVASCCCCCCCRRRCAYIVVALVCSSLCIFICVNLIVCSIHSSRNALLIRIWISSTTGTSCMLLATLTAVSRKQGAPQNPHERTGKQWRAGVDRAMGKLCFCCSTKLARACLVLGLVDLHMTAINCSLNTTLGKCG